MNKVLWLVIPLMLIAVYLAVLPALPAGRQSSDQIKTVANIGSSIPSSPTDVALERLSFSIFPDTILQGDPARITVNGLNFTSTDSISPSTTGLGPSGLLQAIKSLTFDGKPLPVFFYDGKPTALVGIDLRGKIGSYLLVLTLEDGQKIEKKLLVGKRIIAKAPFGIPEKLGGDTPEAEKELINTLIQESTIISAVPTSDEMLWSSGFRFPLADPVIVTDTYGYSRLTGASTISHKGTDLRATLGTSVYAMNSGLVRFVRNLRNYGNTIIIDHGLGLQTIYMHLSEMNVEVGDTVERGELIGKSGDTGYVLAPHLHITVRIGGISIDPMKFMELLGPK
ncbi:MAG: M23 family metallopeptidase [bacterium]|nr:M23 family metallopeptidase [bacterium]